MLLTTKQEVSESSFYVHMVNYNLQYHCHLPKLYKCEQVDLVLEVSYKTLYRYTESFYLRCFSKLALLLQSFLSGFLELL